MISDYDYLISMEAGFPFTSGNSGKLFSANGFKMCVHFVFCYSHPCKYEEMLICLLIWIIIKKQSENGKEFLQSAVSLSQNHLVHAERKQSSALIHLDFSLTSEIFVQPLSGFVFTFWLRRLIQQQLNAAGPIWSHFRSALWPNSVVASSYFWYGYD